MVISDFCEKKRINLDINYIRKTCFSTLLTNVGIYSNIYLLKILLFVWTGASRHVFFHWLRFTLNHFNINNLWKWSKYIFYDVRNHFETYVVIFWINILKNNDTRCLFYLNSVFLPHMSPAYFFITLTWI